MPTYASSSNPFIKANSCTSTNGSSEPPVHLAPKKKNAPGMAMPHSHVSEKPKQEVVLNCNEEYADSTDTKSHINLPNDKDETSVGVVDDPNPNHLKAPSIVSIDDEFDEITKACESLVDTTIKLELEEAALSKKDTCIKDVSVANHDKQRRQTVSHNRPITDGEIDSDPLNADTDTDTNTDADADADRDEIQLEELDGGQRQHIELIKKLRLQLRDLERYAYERGELGQVPASVTAERQTVILNTLKERLSLSIDMNEIEKLELDELKKQVDKEIHELIDPLITKDQLLGQLKTQLTDLERYIAYLHGTIGDDSSTLNGTGNESRLINNDTLPRTTKLIRGLITQLICSDIKLQETAKKAQIFEEKSQSDISKVRGGSGVIPNSPPKAEDDAAWTLHIDKVILATDSLVNLFTTEPQYQRSTETNIDDRLIESIVRRQLVPAIRDLLSYGLIDHSSMPKSTSFISLLFDPYYLLTSLTCFPGSNRASSPIRDDGGGSCKTDKVHLWNVIEDYYQSRNDPTFKTSSVKTLSQSFDLAPSISGPIKITSKQALLIAIDDINETLSRCKPNGPESHFRAFIYTALNRAKLATWLRIIFKNKSIIRRFYHNFSFVSQTDKMDKLLTTIEPLNRFSYKLRTDVESIEQFVSAF